MPNGAPQAEQQAVQQGQDQGDYQSAINSLRSIAGMNWKTVSSGKGMQENKMGKVKIPLLGNVSVPEIGTEGAGSKLSRDQQNLVDTMGRKIFGQHFDISKMTQDQWKQITQYASWAQTNPQQSAIPQLKNPPPSAPGASAPSTQPAPQNPWVTAGNDLANGEKKIASTLGNVISGTDPTVNADKTNATTMEENLVGAAPGSPTDAWIKAQNTQAATNDAPLNQALQAYASAYGQGQQGVNTALGQMGTANAELVQGAPTTPWITGAAAHIQSNLGYSGQIPANELQNLQQNYPEVAQILSTSGAGPGSTSDVPVTALAAPGQPAAAPGALPSGVNTAGTPPTTGYSVNPDTSNAP